MRPKCATSSKQQLLAKLDPRSPESLALDSRAAKGNGRSSGFIDGSTGVGPLIDESSKSFHTFPAWQPSSLDPLWSLIVKGVDSEQHL